MAALVIVKSERSSSGQNDRSHWVNERGGELDRG